MFCKWQGTPGKWPPTLLPLPCDSLRPIFTLVISEILVRQPQTLCLLVHLSDGGQLRHAVMEGLQLQGVA